MGYICCHFQSGFHVIIAKDIWKDLVGVLQFNFFTTLFDLDSWLLHCLFLEVSFLLYMLLIRITEWFKKLTVKFTYRNLMNFATITLDSFDRHYLFLEASFLPYMLLKCELPNLGVQNSIEFGFLFFMVCITEWSKKSTVIFTHRNLTNFVMIRSYIIFVQLSET